MSKQITIQIRNVYGNETIYPIDVAAKTFAAIAGTKTLTTHTLRCVMELGYSIIEIDRYGQPARHWMPGDRSIASGHLVAEARA